MASALYNKGSTSGAKAQDAEWLAEDVVLGIKVNRALRLILQIGISAGDAVVEVSFDSGATWSALNSGTALTAGNLFTFDIYVHNGDLVNFRTPTVGGTTLSSFKVVGDLDA